MGDMKISLEREVEDGIVTDVSLTGTSHAKPDYSTPSSHRRPFVFSHYKYYLKNKDDKIVFAINFLFSNGQLIKILTEKYLTITILNYKFKT
ncbi:hypothetical protein HanIR_Chr06g0268371 [Helianthus annuus]|nr:hypothetical protein HanIR_Chr06g0268371 [Helianthus annuus]